MGHNLAPAEQAALVGSAWVELLEGMGKGWLGALQTRLPVIWLCRSGEPKVLQNSSMMQRQGLVTEMELGEMGQAESVQQGLQTQVAASSQQINLPLLHQSSCFPQDTREKHSNPCGREPVPCQTSRPSVKYHPCETQLWVINH